MNSNLFPRIYLAIDNCFAAKRWTDPRDWARIIREFGLTYVEASADNEIDPLYSTRAFLDSWVTRVQQARDETGVQVVNLYSGHGTYCTLGLAHTDERVRRHLLEDWMVPMVDMAARLDAGLGFFAHAFSQPVLEDAERYEQATLQLYDSLGSVARHAGDNGVTVGVEQMYTPHQIPWTLDGARELMRKVRQVSGHPLYITIDTAHQIGQRKFLRPTAGPAAWFGHPEAHEAFASGKPWKDVESIMDAYPHFFARHADGDPYRWLEACGCYSPIMHLQQTDGRVSAHWPFTAARNASGIIDAEKVLQAITKSYLQEPDDLMPPRCKDLYLTLEIFSSTADYPMDLLQGIRESVDYWRRCIPRDGIKLNELSCVQETLKA